MVRLTFHPAEARYLYRVTYFVYMAVTLLRWLVYL